LTALLLNNLKIRLAEPLPGIAAQKELAPYNRELIETSTLKVGDYKESAVMLLLCWNAEGDLFFPLVQRNQYNGVHSGQIALPGGKKEVSDLDLKSTAIRECVEEIGVQADFQILGGLSPLYIPVSGFLVQPYVSVIGNLEPQFKPQLSEVESVFSVKLDELLKDENLKRGSIMVKNQNILTPYFSFGEKQVWGATAMILNELKQLLKASF